MKEVTMNSLEKVSKIFTRKSDGAGAMWTGHLNDRTIPIYAKEWGLEPNSEAIYSFLGDDCRWFMGDAAYKHPEGLPMFDMSAFGKTVHTSSDGRLADVETVAEVDEYPWPDPKYCDFSGIYASIDAHREKMVFSGMWCPFFHISADLFGMENYFIKMHENPAVVEAVTERIVDFYIETNEKFFQGLGNRTAAMFFGNDFGTQLDSFISLEHFRRFILPSFKRLVAVGKKYGRTVILHSCGSIYRVIPDLIEAGVDVLHPIQAQAAGMDAKNLSQYKNDLAFLGGIDAQSFFVNAKPAQIKDEVRRVRDILGPNIVISPSHEEILPNVPAANILAMAEAAKE